MGDALAELEEILRSSKGGLTAEEENVLQLYKGKAVRDFTITAAIASGLMWTATRNLNYGIRFNFSGGAAVVAGIWRFDKTLNACLKHLLDMKGTRMQAELANLILTRFRDDPKRKQLLEKHFYVENVFIDSNPDQVTTKWRYKNTFFADNGFQTSRDGNYSDKPVEVPDKKIITSAEDMIADPLDCILSHSETLDEHKNFDSTAVPTRHSRNHRRIHRRHRFRHHELSPQVADNEP